MGSQVSKDAVVYMLFMYYTIRYEFCSTFSTLINLMKNRAKNQAKTLVKNQAKTLAKNQAKTW
jgi:hypothetical protein